jgi:calcium-dependent protein kinase
MKVINKYSSSLSPEEEEEILKEINILKMLDHPNIIKVYEYFNTKRKLFIVSELCTGGELFDRITEVKYFTETVAAHIMKQIFSATAFCHANNIIHRDLKPENILIENLEERKKDFFNIKIIDFGTGEVNKHKMLSEKTGTAYYIAPEVINNCYNEKCDLWSCGVILYILLCGCPPFSADTDDEIFKKIKIGKYHLKGSVWKEISKEAIDLVSELLTKDIDKRLSAQQALNHPWFRNMFSDSNKNLLEFQKKNFPLTHLQGIIHNIKTFRAEKKLQQAALAFMVHNLAKVEDVKELKNVFLAFDLDGDGRLTKDELIKGMSQVMTKGEATNDVDKVMSVIDVDKNGYIEYEEFLRATLDKEKLLSRENIKIAFDLFDQDSSGFISKEELRNVLGRGQSKDVPDNVWASIIKEIDSNSDGEISFDEFYEVMSKLIEKESL